MHALDRFGRAVLKIDYEFGNGTTLRSVTGYQEGQHGIPRRPRWHERRQQHLRRHGRRGDLLAGDQPHLLRCRQVQVDPRRLLPARRDTTSRRVSSTSAFPPASTCSTARIRRKPRRCSARSSFDSRDSLGAAGRRALLGQQHRPTTSTSTSTACRSRRSRRADVLGHLSGKVSLNWTSTITTSSTASSPRASARVA